MANTYKRLAASRPADTNEAKLYGPGADTQAIVTVQVCNQDSSEHTYRIAITNTDAAADDEDWIVYDQSISPNGTHTYPGICLENGDTIRVKVDSADDVSFVVYGLEIS